MDVNGSVIEKFWANVEKTNTCWNWMGAQLNGSPIIYYPEKIRPAKLSLLLANKEQQANTQALPLVCKNKLCVNPDHLVSGDEARFWSKVQKLTDDCWIWTGGHNDRMYAIFNVRKDGKSFQYKASHYSWKLFTGRDVPVGLFVCHHCDQPLCVNPHHLFLGTNQDNVDDMVEKGRQAKGERLGSSKLTMETVRLIRDEHMNGSVAFTALAEKYGVTRKTIANVVHRVYWKD